MFLVFSHILAFCVLFIDSLFDLLNNNDIPDEFAVAGIIGGFILHGAYSYFSGSLEAIFWSLGLGTVFSIYGWAAYWKGMWGGADAMILSMVGFAVPTGVSVSGEMLSPLVHSFDFIFNFMISAVGLTVLTSLVYFVRSEDGVKSLLLKLKGRERFLFAELLFSGAFSALLVSQGMNGFMFFGFISGLFLLFEVLRIVERDFFVREVKVEDLQGGEVAAKGQGLGDKVKGIDEDQIEEIEKESIEVREGVPMVPAFLAALLLTDLTSLGVWIMFAFY